MAILEEEVWINCGTCMDKHYELFGYIIPRLINKQGKLKVPPNTKILVKVHHLPRTSSIKITKICDDCGKRVLNVDYKAILIGRECGDGKDRCSKCGNKQSWFYRKENLPYKKSLEYYAKGNSKEYLLNEFSDKNNKKPSKISYGSADEYLWNCSKCNSEYLMNVQIRSLSNNNCPYCSGQRVNHTNCLWTTHPEIAKLLKNQQRGYEINAGRNKKEEFTCDKCGFDQKKIVSNVVNRGKFSCPRCSDGISYPEKILFNVLDQLSVYFETQKVFHWSNKKKYDFYIPKNNLIIETHGRQHYEGNFFEKLGGRTFIEEKENDEFKIQLARLNNIKKYIILDCRESNLEYIKNSILMSELKKIFDLNAIDWIKCHKYASKTTLVKTTCELWNKGIKNTLEISKIIKISRNIVIKYLKQGEKFGWCEYNPKEIMKKNGQKNGQKNKREVVQLAKDNNYIRTWGSIGEAEKELGITNVSGACRGVKKTAGGFIWIYKEVYKNQVLTTT